jgi:MYXO-CTERM domain-containing protein
VDLAPVGASSSAVNAVGGGQQAGVAFFGGQARAGLWSGTASSWVDLAAFLPAGFTDTYAPGISSDGVNIYISGYGTNATGVQALLWTQSVPSPGAVALLALGGLLTARRRR